MKKKYIVVMLMLALAGTALAGCAFNKKDQAPKPESLQISSEPSKEQEPSIPENNNSNSSEQSPQELVSKPDSKNNKEKVCHKNVKANQNKNIAPGVSVPNAKKNSSDYTKISGTFILSLKDCPKCNESKEQKEFMEKLKKEMEKTIYEFKDDGTIFIGQNTKDGQVGVPGTFTQTKDKLIISIGNITSKEEVSYTYDGNTLNLINSKTNLKTTLKRK